MRFLTSLVLSFCLVFTCAPAFGSDDPRVYPETETYPYVSSVVIGQTDWTVGSGSFHELHALRGVQLMVDRISLEIDSITLNGETIDPKCPKLHVRGNDPITGTVRVLATNNNYTASHIIPLAWTTSWGDNQSSFTEIDSWVPYGTTTPYDVPIYVTAPTEIGDHYLWFVMDNRYNSTELMANDRPAVWNDGDDFADMSFDHFTTAIVSGETHYADRLNVAVAGIQVVVERISLDIESITLNGQTIDPAHPKLHVDKNQPIQGTITVRATNNNYTSSHIMPLAWTPSWGDHSTSFEQIDSWVPWGTTTTYSVPIDIVAPDESGAHFLWFVMDNRYNATELMANDRPAVWNDGDDFASMDFEHQTTVFSCGESKFAGKVNLAVRGVQIMVEHTSLDIESITLNGQTIDPENPKLHVDKNQAVTGTIRVRAHNNNYTSSHIMPLGWTPTWGDHASSYSTISSWVPWGTTTSYDVTINVNAPDENGDAYLWFVMDNRYNTGEMMANDRPAVWNDFDDMADIGFRYLPHEGVISGTLTCDPNTGTLPFATTMSVTLINESSNYYRTVAGRIDVDLASGGFFGNWRAGTTNLDPGEVYSVSWSQNLPDLPSLIGDNTFRLTAVDVTQAPYNQPPYPAAGDTDTSACVVTAVQP